ncbi:hypothetical protein BU17DRAFT_53148 [Hysterangium stoloniferum]|nr:hypothetical protein BU17DRAFT_53148 [Hysterangium stoloniferum]
MSLFIQSSPIQTAAYLKTLPSIRERCIRVYELAKQDRLEFFKYSPEKEAEVVNFCINIIQRDFGSNYNSIPPHGRWRHFDTGRPRISSLILEWSKTNSELEVCKRIIDLFLVSVLLDAGAGNTWTYREEGSDHKYQRSEGLAIASLDMFRAGIFSGESRQPYRVDADGLSHLTAERVSSAMQVSASNPMTGIDGRATLLANLAKALRSNPTFFGPDGRPGNMLDFLASESLPSESPEYNARIHVSVLWTILIDGLAVIWPGSRTQLAGISLGDVWPCSALKSSNPNAADSADDLVPFHKLSQWLAYSLIEPIEKILKWKVEGTEDLTGLPEYRNGGLLVDLGVLSLRPDVIDRFFYPDESSSIPRLPPSHPAIIEWRAMTVIELDRIAEMIRKNLDSPRLSLAQVLESATWKGGREIAKQKRPTTGGPPIDIESDGTVF